MKVVINVKKGETIKLLNGSNRTEQQFEIIPAVKVGERKMLGSLETDKVSVYGVKYILNAVLEALESNGYSLEEILTSLAVPFTTSIEEQESIFGGINSVTKVFVEGKKILSILDLKDNIVIKEVKEIKEVKFINLTPHAIVLDDGTVYETNTEYPTIRLNTEEKDTNNSMIKKVVVSVVVCTLPPIVEDTFYIVSAMVGGNVKREDFICPNTAKAKRNEKGHIISVPNFVQY